MPLGNMWLCFIYIYVRISKQHIFIQSCISYKPSLNGDTVIHTFVPYYSSMWLYLRGQANIPYVIEFRGNIVRLHECVDIITDTDNIPLVTHSSRYKVLCGVSRLKQMLYRWSCLYSFLWLKTCNCYDRVQRFVSVWSDKCSPLFLVSVNYEANV